MTSDYWSIYILSNSCMINDHSTKRNCIIDQSISRGILCNTVNVLQTPIITLFLIQGSQPITIKGSDISQS